VSEKSVFFVGTLQNNTVAHSPVSGHLERKRNRNERGHLVIFLVLLAREKKQKNANHFGQPTHSFF